MSWKSALKIYKKNNFKKMQIKLSIIICTIRVKKCMNLIHSMKKYYNNDQIIIILDGIQYDPERYLYNYCKTLNFDIELIENASNLGLSQCRNIGMQKSKYNHVIFFDDDIELISDSISIYKKYFSLGYDVIGGPLMIPVSYKTIPFWLPKGYYSLLGIHSFHKKIWGGNFGFSLKLVRENQLKFQENLGRRGNQLQSGDDTTFIKNLLIYTQKSIFVEKLAVEHHINTYRYKLKYLVRRSFWQGRSEVRRGSVYSGIIKEYNRSKSIFFKKINENILSLLIGKYLFSFFLLGILFETVFNISIKILKKINHILQHKRAIK